MFFNQCVFQVKEALDYLSFLPPKSAEGFLKAIQVQCRVLVFNVHIIIKSAKINWDSFWWCQCVLCYASSSKYFWSLFILYKNVKVFLFTASVKDQFISTWFTYSCVTKGNVLKVTDKYYCPFNYTILHQLMKCITVNLITFLCVSALYEGLKEGWQWWH